MPIKKDFLINSVDADFLYADQLLSKYAVEACKIYHEGYFASVQPGEIIKLLVIPLIQDGGYQICRMVNPEEQFAHYTKQQQLNFD